MNYAHRSSYRPLFLNVFFFKGSRPPRFLPSSPPPPSPSPPPPPPREPPAPPPPLPHFFQAQLQVLRPRHKLRRLTQRLLNISRELNQLGQNACTLAGQ